MRKLILGCGYLGQRVAAAWRRQGQEVAALTRSVERAAEFRTAGLQPIVADVTLPQSLASLPPADTVLYAIGYDRASGRSQDEVSIDGLRNVLRSLPSAPRKFLYVSSTSVYGQSAGEWVEESSPCEPAQTGGTVCLAAEELLRSELPTASILRLAGLYGPDRLLARAESLRRGEPLAGNPEAWLNLIHVEDAVAAVLACEERGQPGETYLVCDDEPVPRREYYTRLASLIGAPPPTFDETQPAKRGSGLLNKRCRNRRLHDELNVRLTFPSYREGLPHALHDS